MLIHPDLAAWLNRMSRTEKEEPKNRPRVIRAGKAAPGDSKRTREIPPPGQPGSGPATEGEVDYLNEKESSFNFYA
jgi:hypothetical protein